MMETYFRVLDILFASNYKEIGPIAMRNIMRNHLAASHDLLEDPNHVIDVWKKNQDPKKLSKTAQKTLELL